MYATVPACRLWEDRPSSPLAQAAKDAPSPGPSAEDIHEVCHMRAPRKTLPVVGPVQLIGWDAMDDPPGHHGSTHPQTPGHLEDSGVEWVDHGKVRRAAAHAPDDEVPPPQSSEDRLRLASRVPDSPEAAWEALHGALHWAKGAPGSPLPLERTPVWTYHATRYAAHMRRHRAGTGHRLLTWPTNMPDALQAAEETLGIMTKQVLQLEDAVHKSNPGVPATREHPVFSRGHAPVEHACTTLHEGLHKPSLTSHTLRAAPTTAESHTGAAPPTRVPAYTRTLQSGAAEALKTTISSHQGLIHPPNDNMQKGYNLWWHHPAQEGGLQLPPYEPGLGPDLIAIAHAVAAVAQQVGAPPQKGRSVIKGMAARHNPAFAHFRDDPFIRPYRTSTSLPTLCGPSTSSCPTTPRPKHGMQQHASSNSSPATHITTIYQHQRSWSPTTRAATTTTSTPRRSATLSPYTPSPPILASSHHGTTRNRHGRFHYTLPPSTPGVRRGCTERNPTTRYPDPRQKARLPRAPSQQQHRPPRSPQTSLGTTPKRPTSTH